MDSNLTTASPASQSASHSAWIDRLFLRFAAMYGNLWMQRWHGTPVEVVKAEWTRGLQNFDLQTIKAALDWCSGNQTFPPSLPEFASVCRNCKERPEGKPLADVPRLSYDFKEARQKIAELTRSMLKPQHEDPLRCFKEIIAGAADGSYTNAYGIRMAKEALGMETARVEH